MSDLMAVRRIEELFSASYPPSVLGVDPHINSLVPNSVSAAAGAVVVHVHGTGFLAGATIEVDQVAVPTTHVSDTELTTSFDPSVAATVQFTVRLGEQESNSVAFNVIVLAADDISGMTVEEVKQFIVRHPDLLAEVEGLERDGKARPTLLAWLAALLDEEQETAMSETTPEPETAPEPEPEVEPETAPEAEPTEPETEPEPEG